MGKIKDGIQFGFRVNIQTGFKPAFDPLASYYLTRISKRTIHWGNPFSISIEPTTSCNLRCPECPSGLRQFSRNTGNADFGSL